MDIALFSGEGPLFLFRWFHFFFGVLWIGLLYYFNFIHGAFMGEAEAAAKPSVVQKLLPRALFWFRWGAVGTFATGLIYLMMRGHSMGGAFMSSNYGVLILSGAGLGTLMFLNVWLIIWPNQQVVIRSSQQVSGGGQALPEAAGSAARALTASRTNTCFSIPMLFFMGAASHLPIRVGEESKFAAYWIAYAIIVGAIEFNAIKGKPGPMATLKGVIHCGFGLAIVLYALVEFMM